MNGIDEPLQCADSPGRQATLFDTLDEGVLVTDADGRITDWNLGAERIFGYTRDEALGRSPSFFHHPNLGDSVESAILVALQAVGHWSGELRFQRKDGSEGIAETVVVAQYDRDGHRIAHFGVNRDVTERATAHNELRAAKARLDGFIHNVPDELWLKDAQGRYLTVNEAYLCARGLPISGVLGKDDFALFPPDLARRFQVEDARVMASGSRVVTEESYRAPDGELRQIETIKSPFRDESGEIVGTVGVARDITARTQAEEQIRFQAQLLDMVGQAVIATDLEGRILYWNSFADTLYGWPAEEVIGKPVSEVIDSRLSAEQLLEVSTRISAGEQWIGEFDIVRRDGSVFPASVVSSPIHDKLGALVGVVGLSSDITPRRELEEQFRQSQKLEAIGRLAGGVAHDFNNLLTAIRGNVELALLDLAPASPLRADLEQVREAAESAASLTRQLLTFSRRQIHEPKVVELNRVIESNVRLLSRLLGTDVEIRTDFAPDLWPVRADPGQIEQVLMNLAVNARDAMPHGGVLSVQTRNLDLPESHSAPRAGQPWGRQVVITVEDDGTGMDDSTRARIFEPFFTTKEQGKGTGLGLSTVYGIMKQSGGSVEVESAPGVGTRFVLRLPAVDVADAAGARDEPSIAPAGGGETVLLVDDEPPVRLLAHRLLRRIGYQVVEASNGEEALDLAAKHPGEIELLLTDLTMPRMDGRELAGRFSAIRPSTRVVFMSGYAEGDALPERMGGAPTAFIAKPFTIHALASTIRRSLDAV